MNKSISGFTLLELMITLAIIAIISAIALPAYNGYIQQGRIAECNNEIAAIMLAESQFFLESNSYFGGSGVAALDTNSAGFYKSSTIANDTNNRSCSYIVTATATGYTIAAKGENKLSSLGTFITKSGP